MYINIYIICGVCVIFCCVCTGFSAATRQRYASFAAPVTEPTFLFLPLNTRRGCAEFGSAMTDAQSRWMCVYIVLDTDAYIIRVNPRLVFTAYRKYF